MREFMPIDVETHSIENRVIEQLVGRSGAVELFGASVRVSQHGTDDQRVTPQIAIV